MHSDECIPRLVCMPVLTAPVLTAPRGMRYRTIATGMLRTTPPA